MAFVGEGYPLKRISSTPTPDEILSKNGSRGDFTRDEAELARFGKKQQLKVPYSLSLFPNKVRLLVVVLMVYFSVALVWYL